MQFNTIKPAAGSKPKSKRLGRGIGSGKGKTCGFGHKGQKARSGAGMMLGFEGGQMPIQRRLPKFGFTSRKAMITDEVRLHELNKFEGKVDLETLHKAGLIDNNIKRVKVIATGKLEKAITLVGIKVTAGARKLIEAAGGKVED